MTPLPDSKGTFPISKIVLQALARLFHHCLTHLLPKDNSLRDIFYSRSIIDDIDAADHFPRQSKSFDPLEKQALFPSRTARFQGSYISTLAPGKPIDFDSVAFKSVDETVDALTILAFFYSELELNTLFSFLSLCKYEAPLSLVPDKSTKFEGEHYGGSQQLAQGSPRTTFVPRTTQGDQFTTSITQHQYVEGIAPNQNHFRTTTTMSSTVLTDLIVFDKIVQIAFCAANDLKSDRVTHAATYLIISAASFDPVHFFPLYKRVVSFLLQFCIHTNDTKKIFGYEMLTAILLCYSRGNFVDHNQVASDILTLIQSTLLSSRSDSEDVSLQKSRTSAFSTQILSQRDALTTTPSPPLLTAQFMFLSVYVMIFQIHAEVPTAIVDQLLALPFSAPLEFVLSSISSTQPQHVDRIQSTLIHSLKLFIQTHSSTSLMTLDQMNSSYHSEQALTPFVDATPLFLIFIFLARFSFKDQDLTFTIPFLQSNISSGSEVDRLAACLALLVVLQNVSTQSVAQTEKSQLNQHTPTTTPLAQTLLSDHVSVLLSTLKKQNYHSVKLFLLSSLQPYFNTILSQHQHFEVIEQCLDDSYFDVHFACSHLLTRLALSSPVDSRLIQPIRSIFFKLSSPISVQPQTSISRLIPPNHPNSDAFDPIQMRLRFAQVGPHLPQPPNPVSTNLFIPQTDPAKDSEDSQDPPQTFSVSTVTIISSLNQLLRKHLPLSPALASQVSVPPHQNKDGHIAHPLFNLLPFFVHSRTSDELVGETYTITQTSRILSMLLRTSNGLYVSSTSPSLNNQYTPSVIINSISTIIPIIFSSVQYTHFLRPIRATRQVEFQEVSQYFLLLSLQSILRAYTFSCLPDSFHAVSLNLVNTVLQLFLSSNESPLAVPCISTLVILLTEIRQAGIELLTAAPLLIIAYMLTLSSYFSPQVQMKAYPLIGLVGAIRSDVVRSIGMKLKKGVKHLSDSSKVVPHKPKQLPKSRRFLRPEDLKDLILPDPSQTPTTNTQAFSSQHSFQKSLSLSRKEDYDLVFNNRTPKSWTGRAYQQRKEEFVGCSMAVDDDISSSDSDSHSSMDESLDGYFRNDKKTFDITKTRLLFSTRKVQPKPSMLWKEKDGWMAHKKRHEAKDSAVNQVLLSDTFLRSVDASLNALPSTVRSTFVSLFSQDTINLTPPKITNIGVDNFFIPLVKKEKEVKKQEIESGTQAEEKDHDRTLNIVGMGINWDIPIGMASAVEGALAQNHNSLNPPAPARTTNAPPLTMYPTHPLYPPYITLVTLLNDIHSKDPPTSILAATFIQQADILKAIVRILCYQLPNSDAYLFIPLVIPSLLNRLYTVCESACFEMAELILAYIGELICSFKRYFHPYYADILSLICTNWPSLNQTIVLSLLDKISFSHPDALVPYLHFLVPQFVVLLEDALPQKQHFCQHCRSLIESPTNTSSSDPTLCTLCQTLGTGQSKTLGTLMFTYPSTSITDSQNTPLYEEHVQQKETPPQSSPSNSLSAIVTALSVLQILRILVSIGKPINDYFHLFVPVLTKLIECHPHKPNKSPSEGGSSSSVISSFMQQSTTATQPLSSSLSPSSKPRGSQSSDPLDRQSDSLISSQNHNILRPLPTSLSDFYTATPAFFDFVHISPDPHILVTSTKHGVSHQAGLSPHGDSILSKTENVVFNFLPDASRMYSSTPNTSAQTQKTTYYIQPRFEIKSIFRSLDSTDIELVSLDALVKLGASLLTIIAYLHLPISTIQNNQTLSPSIGELDEAAVALVSLTGINPFANVASLPMAVVEALRALILSLDVAQHSASLVHLFRAALTLHNPPPMLKESAHVSLCFIAAQLGYDFVNYLPSVMQAYVDSFYSVWRDYDSFPKKQRHQYRKVPTEPKPKAHLLSSPNRLDRGSSESDMGRRGTPLKRLPLGGFGSIQTTLTHSFEVSESVVEADPAFLSNELIQKQLGYVMSSFIGRITTRKIDLPNYALWIFPPFSLSISLFIRARAIQEIRQAAQTKLNHFHGNANLPEFVRDTSLSFYPPSTLGILLTPPSSGTHSMFVNDLLRARQELIPKDPDSDPITPVQFPSRTHESHIQEAMMTTVTMGGGQMHSSSETSPISILQQIPITENQSFPLTPFNLSQYIDSSSPFCVSSLINPTYLPVDKMKSNEDDDDSFDEIAHPPPFRQKQTIPLSQIESSPSVTAEKMDTPTLSIQQSPISSFTSNQNSMSYDELWERWFDAFCTSLLKSSPHPALRACTSIPPASTLPIARALFPYSAVAQWERSSQFRSEYVSATIAAISSEHVPTHMKHALFSLLPFLERECPQTILFPSFNHTMMWMANALDSKALFLHYAEKQHLRHHAAECTVTMRAFRRSELLTHQYYQETKQDTTTMWNDFEFVLKNELLRSVHNQRTSFRSTAEALYPRSPHSIFIAAQEETSRSRQHPQAFTEQHKEASKLRKILFDERQKEIFAAHSQSTIDTQSYIAQVWKMPQLEINEDTQFDLSVFLETYFTGKPNGSILSHPLQSQTPVNISEGPNVFLYDGMNWSSVLLSTLLSTNEQRTVSQSVIVSEILLSLTDQLHLHDPTLLLQELHTTASLHPPSFHTLISTSNWEEASKLFCIRPSETLTPTELILARYAHINYLVSKERWYDVLNETMDFFNTLLFPRPISDPHFPNESTAVYLLSKIVDPSLLVDICCELKQHCLNLATKLHCYSSVLSILSNANQIIRMFPGSSQFSQERSDLQDITFYTMCDSNESHSTQVQKIEIVSNKFISYIQSLTPEYQHVVPASLVENVPTLWTLGEALTFRSSDCCEPKRRMLLDKWKKRAELPSNEQIRRNVSSIMSIALPIEETLAMLEKRLRTKWSKNDIHLLGPLESMLSLQSISQHTQSSAEIFGKISLNTIAIRKENGFLTLPNALQTLYAFTASIPDNQPQLKAHSVATLVRWCLSAPSIDHSNLVQVDPLPLIEDVLFGGPVTFPPSYPAALLHLLEGAIQIAPAWHNGWVALRRFCSFSAELLSKPESAVQTGESVPNLQQTRTAQSLGISLATNQITRSSKQVVAFLIAATRAAASAFLLASTNQLPVFADHLLATSQPQPTKTNHMTESNQFTDSISLLRLWLRFGSIPQINSIFMETVCHIPESFWIWVVPQLMAWLYSPGFKPNFHVHSLVADLAGRYPQSFIFPLLLAHTSALPDEQTQLVQLMATLPQQTLTDGILVSSELVRVAITLCEAWPEAIAEAKKLFLAEKRPDKMLARIAHQLISSNRRTKTAGDIAFHHMYDADILTACECLDKFHNIQNKVDIAPALPMLEVVMKRCRVDVEQMKDMQINTYAPELALRTHFSLAIPGTVMSSTEWVNIHSFKSHVAILHSKQRPRRIEIEGEDGCMYPFLLKGHEDIRLDERMMQLLGLVNVLLSRPSLQSRLDGTIQTRSEFMMRTTKYPAVPLSPNVGLIGWVPNCDSMVSLVMEYRERMRVSPELEKRLTFSRQEEFDELTMMQKVDFFEHVKNSTTGADLFHIMYWMSRTPELWLERRQSYTQSFASMSAVGYLMGLGDRHPSNILIDRVTGGIVHIDYGDCFDVAMRRKQTPERVSFRLTRMVVNAFENTSAEGLFKPTFTETLRLLQHNKESIASILESFLVDPLTSWRIYGAEDVQPPGEADKYEDPDKEEPDSMREQIPQQKQDAVDDEARNQAEQAQMNQMTGEAPPAITELAENFPRSHPPNEIAHPADFVDAVTHNRRATEEYHRILEKLEGRMLGQALSTEQQAEFLISQAQNHINLAQMFLGWCIFW
ncbi:putative serine/threonine protein kinase [Blattamonas nauphoetae]|uniref:Serine/threonine protein kinase n=1 Tax=Blattamonas nauphoetae TaxID=2049346 RepID=A0ABQ9XFQ3_9EUKA|nr:putative serine/threonine protein kinase [Blattamonas nauphoetae]